MPSELIEARQTFVARNSDGLLRAWDRRRQICADVMTGLENLIQSDPQAVAGVGVENESVMRLLIR